VLAQIADLMAELRPAPEEEQFLWGKYGGQGGQPGRVERLVEMRDYLAVIVAKRQARLKDQQRKR
jgi:hypothetical protein